MKDFNRKNLSFSLCGLNCSLCPINLDQHCPGCGGGAGNQSCSIARCSLEQQTAEYCFQCSHYPCERYDNIDRFDSFITHRHQKQDIEKFRKLGEELYSAELQRKRDLLDHLLRTYNDGRRKTLFCVAVNLLELDDLKHIIQDLDSNTADLPLKEKAAYAASSLQKTAADQNITLKLLRKK